MKVYELM